MDIRSSLEGLNSILGTSQTASSTAAAKVSSAATSQSALSGDQATLSNAGSAVSDSASDSGVRADKVASIQAALAAGTYNVSPAMLASKLVDSMLGASQ